MMWVIMSRWKKNDDTILENVFKRSVGMNSQM